LTTDQGSPEDARRSEVLARIIGALVDRPPARPIPRAYRRHLAAGADLLDLFATRVADYRATVHRTDVVGLPATIGDIIASRGIGRLVAPEGFPDRWLVASTAGLFRDVPPLSVDVLDAIDATITTCAVALAETGSFVLDGSAGQGRRVLSLLPDRLICVVGSEQVVGTVPEALERLDPRRPLTWISGPSATSDIELERIEGVHGPRVLDVVLVGARPGHARRPSSA
jgi:L-lactate dehydrogenase complex protein LldG